MATMFEFLWLLMCNPYMASNNKILTWKVITLDCDGTW